MPSSSLVEVEVGAEVEDEVGVEVEVGLILLFRVAGWLGWSGWISRR